MVSIDSTLAGDGVSVVTVVTVEVCSVLFISVKTQIARCFRPFLWAFAVAIACSSVLGKQGDVVTLKFTGVLKYSGSTYVAIAEDRLRPIIWIPVGGTSGKIKVERFDAQTETVFISLQGTPMVLHLKDSRVEYGAAPLSLQEIENLATAGNVKLKALLRASHEVETGRLDLKSKIEQLEAKERDNPNDPEVAEYLPKMRDRLDLLNGQSGKLISSMQETARRERDGPSQLKKD